MLKAGAPFAAAMAFLFSSPLLNPVIISLFVILLGWKVTALYFVVVFMSTIAIGLLLDWLGFSNQIKPVAVVRNRCAEQDTNAKSRIQRSAVFALVFSVSLCLISSWEQESGHLFTDLYQQKLSPVAGPSNPLAVPVAAIIGVPIYIRAETMIPIGLALIKKGMSVGAVLALIIGGAGASIPEMTLLSSIFKKRLLTTFVITVFSIAVIAGYLANLLTL